MRATRSVTLLANNADTAEQYAIWYECGASTDLLSLSAYTSKIGSALVPSPDDYYAHGEIRTGAGLRTDVWDYSTGLRDIKSQQKKVREVSVSILCTSAEEMDKIIHAFDIDVHDGKPGKLHVAVYGESDAPQELYGDWYTRCYVTSIEVDVLTNLMITATCKFVLVDGGVWYHDVTNVLVKGSISQSYEFLDYPHGYPYDYSITLTGATITVPHGYAADVDAEITIVGPAIDPYVIIAGNRYQVNDSISDGWQIVINTRDKTVQKISNTGIVSNIFDLGVRGDGEGSGEYIFERIPSGDWAVSWSSSQNLQIVVYEERVMPPWAYQPTSAIQPWL